MSSIKENIRERLRLLKTYDNVTDSVITDLIRALKNLEDYFLENNLYGKYILEYLNLLAEFKRKCLRRKKQSIIYGKFSQVTHLIGVFLTVSSPIEYEFAMQIIKIWITVTKNIPKDVKLKALEENRDVFLQVVIFMAEVGHIYIQMNLLEILIRYTELISDDKGVSLLVALFKDAGFDAGNSLERFKLDNLDYQMREFLNDFNKHTKQSVISFPVRCVTFEEKVLSASFGLKWWIDFNFGMKSISVTYDAHSIDPKESHILIHSEINCHDIHDMNVTEREDDVKVICILLNNPPLISAEHMIDAIRDVAEVKFVVEAPTADRIAQIISSWTIKDRSKPKTGDVTSVPDAHSRWIDEMVPQTQDSKKEKQSRKRKIKDVSNKENVPPNQQLPQFVDQLNQIVVESHNLEPQTCNDSEDEWFNEGALTRSDNSCTKVAQNERTGIKRGHSSSKDSKTIHASETSDADQGSSIDDELKKIDEAWDRFEKRCQAAPSEPQLESDSDWEIPTKKSKSEVKPVFLKDISDDEVQVAPEAVKLTGLGIKQQQKAEQKKASEAIHVIKNLAPSKRATKVWDVLIKQAISENIAKKKSVSNRKGGKFFKHK